MGGVWGGRIRGQGLERDNRAPGRTYLGFDANLHDGAGDGEHIAGDQQDVPAIDKFQPIPEADDPSPLPPHEPNKLLQEAGGVRAGPGKGPSLPQPLGPPSWVRLAQEHTRDTGGSAHVLQQKATEQRAGTQQEREGAREDHDHIEQESEAVVSCGERTWSDQEWLGALEDLGLGQA